MRSRFANTNSASTTNNETRTGVNAVTHRGIGARIIGVCVLCGAVAFPNSPACAQNVGATDGQGLEEIVVTATRRETDLEKTPISISVLAGADIEKNHVVD